MLSHINAENLPTMVDVGDKAVTRREAEAMSCVSLPRVRFGRFKSRWGADFPQRSCVSDCHYRRHNGCQNAPMS
jgi:hypothetical protein